MDSLPPRCFEILLLIISIGLLRCMEASAEGANDAKLQKIAEGGDKRAQKALALLENSGKFYSFAKVVMVAAEIAAIFEFSQILALFPGMSMLNKTLALAALAIVMLVFSVYVPKRIASLFSDSIVLALNPLMRLVYYIGMPFAVVLTAVSNAILLIFGIHPGDKSEEVTEDDIRMMVDIGSESGAIDPDEKEMIHNIFELDDTQVKDIMTHRTDTDILWLDEADKWEEIISDSNHSIYPVCSDSIDNITGILKRADFYKTLLAGGDVTAILKSAYFVPETIKADDLFRQMQKTKTHFAVVLDEYGGLGGIITMSDLLEEIVGTLSDDSENPEDEDLIKIDANTWKIAGSCDIDLVSDELGIDLPIEEYNTFAGMILGELGEIPEDGSTPELEAYGMQIKVKKILDHRIEYALVTLLEKVQEDN